MHMYKLLCIYFAAAAANLAAGVPDTPEIFINNDGIATWREVNSRSGESIDFYRVTATVDGMEVGGINVPPVSRDGNITQPLSDLGLQVDQRYNICVTAKNIIGHSSPGCNGFMETEGTCFQHLETVFSPILLFPH